MSGQCPDSVRTVSTFVHSRHHDVRCRASASLYTWCHLVWCHLVRVCKMIHFFLWGPWMAACMRLVLPQASSFGLSVQVGEWWPPHSWMHSRLGRVRSELQTQVRLAARVWVRNWLQGHLQCRLRCDHLRLQEYPSRYRTLHAGESRKCRTTSYHHGHGLSMPNGRHLPCRHMLLSMLHLSSCRMECRELGRRSYVAKAGKAWQ